MQLDKLQIDLRPRANPQALDLGFALLRSHARAVYLAWLALWLPLVFICGVIAYFFPAYGGAWWILIPWWLRPLLERAPLYVLSRQVFGQAVTWQEAVRAWPKQLGGGWFRMLTWWRPFASGRGLYQPIWQLENARGKVASERRRVIGRDTIRSAFWFGTACAHFEVVLQIGLIAFVGIFFSDGQLINPFSFLFGAKQDSLLVLLLTFGSSALSGAIIGPIYTACCFTLYLNRRATLEAWDVEIMLRQIEPPHTVKKYAKTLASYFLPALLVVTLATNLTHTTPAEAGTVSTVTEVKTVPFNAKCAAPKWAKNSSAIRAADHSPEQTQLRKEVTNLFDSEDLRTYACEESWRVKDQSKDQPEANKNRDLPELSWLATLIKILLIVGAISIVVWLLYRYQDQFGGFFYSPRAKSAMEIGGLDIRPETLPENVTAAALQLWAEGKQRAAMALLYRATLSRLVDENGLILSTGATEGDCLRLAKRAQVNQQLSMERFNVTESTTGLWLNGAYADRWPQDIKNHCAQWCLHFDAASSGEAK